MIVTDIFGLDSNTYEWVLIETVLGDSNRLAASQALTFARMDGWEDVKAETRVQD